MPFGPFARTGGQLHRLPSTSSKILDRIDAANGGGQKLAARQACGIQTIADTG
jgi:hypothetical protein